MPPLSRKSYTHESNKGLPWPGGEGLPGGSPGAWHVFSISGGKFYTQFIRFDRVVCKYRILQLTTPRDLYQSLGAISMVGQVVTPSPLYGCGAAWGGWQGL